MNIYLACTVRGDRGAISVTRALADAIECMGHTVLTRHLLAAIRMRTRADSASAQCTNAI